MVYNILGNINGSHGQNWIMCKDILNKFLHDCKLTIAERIIAGIPKARDIKLRIAQMMVVTIARIRKSCGALYGGCGATATIGN